MPVPRRSSSRRLVLPTVWPARFRSPVLQVAARVPPVVVLPVLVRRW
ncbi:hypothetical protein ACXPWS_09400 [Mycobacterium sp. BMJ-28]